MEENNMPDKAEQPVLDNTAAQNAPTPPGLTTEKAESPAHEGAGASASPKPAPSREPIPIFKENTISTMSGPEKPAPAQRGRPKAEKAPQAPAAEDNRPPWEKPLSEPQPPAKKRGRKPAADKQDKPAASTVKKAVAPKDAPAPTEEVPSVPREAPRPVEAEQVVFIPLSELHPFKDHPFGVRDDKEMRALAESVKEKGVNQPALVRPRPEGGYELIAGHRRHKASELAGFTDMRCIVRNMTDEEATAIIGVAGTLLGTILGWILNCVYESRKSKFRLCVVLQASKDMDDTPRELKTKYSNSGYCLHCYNIGQSPFFIDNMTLFHKGTTIIDGIQASGNEAILPYNFCEYELTVQEYDNLLYHCQNLKIKKCDVVAYDISGKKCKAKLDLFHPAMQSSFLVDQGIVKAKTSPK